jgi:hypothetical protein
MKSSHFFVAVGLAASCFILSVTLIFLGIRNHGLQDEVQRLQAQAQTQQEQIDGASAVVQRIGPNLLRDMDAMSPDDPPMKAILVKHGYKPSVSTAPPNL